MEDIKKIIARIKRSELRSKFTLSKDDRKFIKQNGWKTIRNQCYDFVNDRLAAPWLNGLKDGNQTPFKGHPVFVAQHATATYNRSSLSKWYRIPADDILTSEQVDLIVQVIMFWLTEEMENHEKITT